MNKQDFVWRVFVSWFPGTESRGLGHKVPADCENPGCCEGDRGWAHGPHLVSEDSRWRMDATSKRVRVTFAAPGVVQNRTNAAEILLFFVPG